MRSGAPFVHYIRIYAMNRPDEWVSPTADHIWKRAMVLILSRDAGMQLDNMSNTVKFSLVVWSVPNVMTTRLIVGHKHDEMAAFTEGAGNLRRRGAQNLNTSIVSLELSMET